MQCPNTHLLHCAFLLTKVSPFHPAPPPSDCLQADTFLSLSHPLPSPSLLSFFFLLGTVVCNTVTEFHTYHFTFFQFPVLLLSDHFQLLLREHILSLLYFLPEWPSPPASLPTVSPDILIPFILSATPLSLILNSGTLHSSPAKQTQTSQSRATYFFRLSRPSISAATQGTPGQQKL